MIVFLDNQMAQDILFPDYLLLEFHSSIMIEKLKNFTLHICFILLLFTLILPLLAQIS